MLRLIGRLLCLWEGAALYFRSSLWRLEQPEKGNSIVQNVPVLARGARDSVGPNLFHALVMIRESRRRYVRRLNLFSPWMGSVYRQPVLIASGHCFASVLGVGVDIMAGFAHGL